MVTRIRIGAVGMENVVGLRISYHIGCEVELMMTPGFVAGGTRGIEVVVFKWDGEV